MTRLQDRTDALTHRPVRRLVGFTALILLGGLALPLSAAKIYQYTNSAGETVFTDEPVAGAKVLEVESAPVIPMTPPAEPAPPADEPVEQRPIAPSPSSASSSPPGSMPYEPPGSDYTRVAITAPADGEMASRLRGSITVQLEIEPGLHSGDRIAILVDGEPRVKDSSGQRHLINPIAPGVHELIAQIRRDDEILIQSAPVRFTLVLPTQ